jgi:hypothetical protein
MILRWCHDQLDAATIMEEEITFLRYYVNAPISKRAVLPHLNIAGLFAFLVMRMHRKIRTLAYL